MEVSLSELKQMEAVNICDGKRLGKVCDVAFNFPEGKVTGIVVPGGKGLRWGKPDLFIDLKNVVKIGVDVVLVELKNESASEKRKREKNSHDGGFPAEISRYDRRDYGEYE